MAAQGLNFGKGHPKAIPFAWVCETSTWLLRDQGEKSLCFSCIRGREDGREGHIPKIKEGKREETSESSASWIIQYTAAGGVAYTFQQAFQQVTKG